jgi:hypothetical protein
LIAPPIAYGVFELTIRYRIGNGRTLSGSLLLTLFAGAVCGIYFARHCENLLIRIAASLLSAMEFLWALAFFWAATVGVG